jgi:hypothetical protein
MPRSLLVLATWLALFALGAPALASEQTDLEKGRAAYHARQFDEADARFRTMLDAKTGSLRDPVLVTQARMYWGAVMMAKGKPDDAAAQFEKLLLAEPGFEPDPLSFPTEVIDLFIDTRAKIHDKISAAAQAAAQAEAARKAREAAQRAREIARVATLERMAAEERVTSRHSRFIALVPFGAGQFQNGQRAWGWVFLTTESALALATAVTLPLYRKELQDRSEAYPADPVRVRQYIDRAKTIRYVNLALVGTLAGVAIIGIVQAQLNYVPEEVEVKKRPIPKAAFAPLIAPSFGGKTEGGRGLVLGITGTF